MSAAVTEELLDSYAEGLAGRLLMILHLDDVRQQFHSDSSVFHDHDRLDLYGYDTASCLCLLMRGRVKVSVWAAKTCQIAS